MVGDEARVDDDRDGWESIRGRETSRATRRLLSVVKVEVETGVVVSTWSDASDPTRSRSNEEGTAAVRLAGGRGVGEKVVVVAGGAAGAGRSSSSRRRNLSSSEARRALRATLSLRSNASWVRSDSFSCESERTCSGDMPAVGELWREEDVEAKGVAEVDATGTPVDVA